MKFNGLFKRNEENTGMKERKLSIDAGRELGDAELDMVTGGAYVNMEMTIGQIIKTDPSLMKVLTSVGINVNNRALHNLSLTQVSKELGFDPLTIENRMNDYLS